MPANDNRPPPRFRRLADGIMFVLGYRLAFGPGIFLILTWF